MNFWWPTTWTVNVDSKHYPCDGDNAWDDIHNLTVIKLTRWRASTQDSHQPFKNQTRGVITCVQYVYLDRYINIAFHALAVSTEWEYGRVDRDRGMTDASQTTRQTSGPVHRRDQPGAVWRYCEKNNAELRHERITDDDERVHFGISPGRRLFFGMDYAACGDTWARCLSLLQ